MITIVESDVYYSSFCRHAFISVREKRPIIHLRWRKKVIEFGMAISKEGLSFSLMDFLVFNVYVVTKNPQ